MGIENFIEKNNTDSLENIFEELTENEKKMKAKIKSIFRENAKLNGLLVSDQLNMTDSQKIYYASKLKYLRHNVKKLRVAITNFEIPEELRGVKAVDKYCKEMKKAA